jgi:5-methylcytosine-specific restriction protein A
MPYRPSVPCKHPGCSSLVPYGSGSYCDKHKELILFLLHMMKEELS